MSRRNNLCLHERAMSEKRRRKGDKQDNVPIGNENVGENPLQEIAKVLERIKTKRFAERKMQSNVERKMRNASKIN